MELHLLLWHAFMYLPCPTYLIWWLQCVRVCSGIATQQSWSNLWEHAYTQNIRIGLFGCLIRIFVRMTLVSSRDSVKCKWPGLSLPPGLSLCSRISGSLSFGKSLFVKESFLRILFLRILFPYSIPNNFSFSSYPYIHISFPKMRFSSGEEVRSKIGNRILSSQPIRMGQIWFDRSHRVIRGVSWEYNDMNIPDSTRKVTLRGPRGCSIPFSGVPYSEAERSSRVWTG